MLNMEVQQQQAVRDPVKEIEVTAKQIVDRISNNHSGAGGVTGAGSGTANQGQDPKGDRRDKPVLLKRVSLSSSYGEQDGKVESTTGNGSGPETETGAGLNAETDSTVAEEAIEPSEHQKKAEILLSAVTKWLGETGHDSQAKLSGGDLAVHENFHWAYSIESYIRNLNWSSQKALTSKIMTLVINWHKQLFHFNKEKRKEDDVEYNRVLPHWEINAGMIGIVKFNLITHFPNFPVQGFEAFSTEGKSPILFCSNETVGQQVATKVGLPHSYVQVLDTQDAHWVTNLEKTILEINKNDKVPLALIINVDAKNLNQAYRLAEVYNIWLHLFGSNLIPYLISRPENSQIGSSFTLDINKWISNPAIPYLTFFKNPGKSEPALLELCDLTSANSDIMVFTPWFVLNVLGHEEVTSLVRDVTERGKFLFDLVQKYKCLHVVPNWSELSNGNVIVTSLTFQYNPPHFSRHSSKDEVKDSSDAEGDGVAPVDYPTPQYVDTLNSWLYHIMDRDLKEFVPVDFINSESGGWNIHIDVVNCPKYEPEDESVIASLLDNHLSVLQSTVAQKQVFSRLVEEADELAWVDHESQWAGLGAVRYIPSFHRKKFNEINGETSTSTNDSSSTSSSNEDTSAVGVKENIDHLNAQIVDKLKAIDTAFSLGESSNGEWCVQFGMVTLETDVKELVRLVIASGQEIEESSEFLDRMSELVKKGIEKATEELKRESEEALWEEGILRRVPVVGTFVNWLSPPVKETGVRGRALNLTQGKVESTENIYKYHMQVEASPTSHGAQQ